MKWVFVVMFLLPLEVISQVALLDKVSDFIQSKQYDKAEGAVLLAEKNISTANDARTYYLKAFVYKELFLNADPGNREGYRNICIESINRGSQLDHDNALKQPIAQLREFVQASLYNDGVEHYNAQEYRKGIRHFKRFVKNAVTQNSFWLDAHYFIGSSYNSLNVYDSAAWYLEVARTHNYDQPILYVDLSYLYMNVDSLSKALKTINEGVSQYRDFLDIRIAQLNILSKFQKYDTLEMRLEEFLKEHPNHIEVLLMAGSVFEKLTNDDTRQKYVTKSEEVYQRVISIDSQNFDANYNLGVLYYNEAVEIVNKNGLETDIAELTKVLEHSTKLFEKALPLLLKIYNPSEKNIKILQALQAIYYNLNMKSELTEINSLIKATNQG